MPTLARNILTSWSASRMFLPRYMMAPSARWPGYRSYMRLSVRSSVDLPQPDGPMKAVTCFSWMSRLTLVRLCIYRRRNSVPKSRWSCAWRSWRRFFRWSVAYSWSIAYEEYRSVRDFLAEQRARQDVQRQYAEGHQQRAAPGQRAPVVVRAHGELVDHHRQVGDRHVHVGAEELVVERGEQQRRGLARDAGQRQQHAGDHAGLDGAQAHQHRHLPARRAEGEGRFEQAVGHQAQHVVGGAHHHRHGDQRQRDGAGITGEVVGVGDVQRVDEQADDDRRRRQHDVGDEAGHGGDLVFLAVLGQVDAGQDADRGADRRRQADQQQAAGDGVDQATALAARRRRVLREHVDAERAEAFVQQRGQDPHEEGQAQRHGEHRQRDADAVHHQALAVDGIDDGSYSGLAHYLTPCLRDIPPNISLAADRTIKVITNRISASAYSDDTCSGVSASANSLARVEAIELPAENSDHDSELALPMTKVTAMVSPSARPRPSMTPPTTPVLV